MLGSSRSTPTEESAAASPVENGLDAALPGAGKNRRGARYEVQERIGEGALWIAYRVRPAPPAGAKNGAAKGTSLVLKALRGAANRHQSLSATLDAQAVRWSELSHPHLASPSGWGFESGTYYFTSPLLTGGSLEKRLARGPLSNDEAMQLLRSLASALSFLHAQNVVHGDVRPRQVLFDSSGFPVLTDGGHAEALAEAGLALSDLQPDAALYLAPERSSGSAPSAAADIYSLGATFYAALTGHAPFEGSSPLAVAARHRNEAPAPPSTLNAQLPAEWDALSLRLLAKNPAERPTAAALERVLTSRPRKNKDAFQPGVAPVPTVAEDPFVAPQSAPDSTSMNASPTQVIEPPVQAIPTEQEIKRTRKKAKRRHGWREFAGMIAAIVCLCLLVGGGVAGAIMAYKSVLAEIPKEVTVPKYLGLRQDKAKAILNKSGLSMKVVRESYDPKVPVGTVMEGDPEPGRDVRARREVFVTVSAGEAPIKMVDFSQLTLDQARSIILQHGMKLGSIAEQYDEKTPRGAILGQYPQPGDAFSRAQPITLIVSRGAQPKEIDVQRGELAPPDPLESAAASPDAPFDTGDTFAPLEPLNGAAPPGQTQPHAANLEKKSAVVRINIPKGSGAQLVRILVSDAKGERTVYQKARKPGTTFNQNVTVLHAPGQQASVRVFIGESLATEQQF